MREAFVTCDHCRDKTSQNHVLSQYYQFVEVHFAAGTAPTRPIVGDLCEGCQNELEELVKGFFAGPKREAS